VQRWYIHKNKHILQYNYILFPMILGSYFIIHKHCGNEIFWYTLYRYLCVHHHSTISRCFITTYSSTRLTFWRNLKNHFFSKFYIVCLCEYHFEFFVRHAHVVAQRVKSHLSLSWQKFLSLFFIKWKNLFFLEIIHSIIMRISLWEHLTIWWNFITNS
jgi:hypothetical protein